MRLSKDKKIYIYIFLLIFLGSINNQSFIKNEFFKVQNLKFNGLKENEKLLLIPKFNEIENQNIFFISKDKIKKVFNSNNLIESFFVYKHYPSALEIEIKKTSFLANIEIEGESFLIGSNKKFIKTKINNDALPAVSGNPSIEDFFKIKKNITDSLFNFSNIKKFIFFPSKRWDLEFKNGTLVKLPINENVNVLNNCYKIMKSSSFDNAKTIDMRIKNQIIVDER